MSISNYERWTWRYGEPNYDPNLVQYTGEDMNDAFQAGNQYYEDSKRLRQENEALRGLLAANVRVIKEELRKEMNAK